jgi:hypothetical protein
MSVVLLKRKVLKFDKIKIFIFVNPHLIVNEIISFIKQYFTLFLNKQ